MWQRADTGTRAKFDDNKIQMKVKCVSEWKYDKNILLLLKRASIWVELLKMCMFSCTVDTVLMSQAAIYTKISGLFYRVCCSSWLIFGELPGNGTHDILNTTWQEAAPGTVDYTGLLPNKFGVKQWWQKKTGDDSVNLCQQNADREFKQIKLKINTKKILLAFCMFSKVSVSVFLLGWPLFSVMHN